MKVQLLFRDRATDPEQPLPANADDLKQDLELDTLLDVMASDDPFLREQAEHGLLGSLTDPAEIRYRQEVLRDCLDNADAARALYAIAIDALDSKQKTRHFWFRDSPEQLVAKSVRILEYLTENLRQLRQLAETQRPSFSSEGFTRLFAMLEDQLDEPYLSSIEAHLRELSFRRGTLIAPSSDAATVAPTTCCESPTSSGCSTGCSHPTGPPSHSFTLPARDEHGMETLAMIRNRGVNQAADALAQSVDHILGFFATLRAELGFYLACLNLHEQLRAKQQPTCFPDPVRAGTDTFNAEGLYDASLVFHLDGPVIGNDIAADRKRLLMITGANRRCDGPAAEDEPGDDSDDEPPVVVRVDLDLEGVPSELVELPLQALRVALEPGFSRSAHAALSAASRGAPAAAPPAGCCAYRRRRHRRHRPSGSGRRSARRR